MIFNYRSTEITKIFLETVIFSIFILTFGIYYCFNINVINSLIDVFLLWGAMILIVISAFFSFIVFKRKYVEELTKVYLAFTNWFFFLGSKTTTSYFDLYDVFNQNYNEFTKLTNDSSLLNSSQYSKLKNTQMDKELLYLKIDELTQKLEDSQSYYLATRILLPFPIAIALVFGKISLFYLLLFAAIVLLIPLLIEFLTKLQFVPIELFNGNISKNPDSEKLRIIYDALEKGYSPHEAISLLVNENKKIDLLLFPDLISFLRKNRIFSFNLLHPLIIILFSFSRNDYLIILPKLIEEIDVFEKKIKVLLTKKKVFNLRNTVMSILGVFSLSTYFNLTPFFHMITNYYVYTNLHFFMSIIYSVSILFSSINYNSKIKLIFFIIIGFISWFLSFLLIKSIFFF